MRDADSPAADTPHLIRQLEFHHVLLDACQVVLKIAVLLMMFGKKAAMNLSCFTNGPLPFNILFSAADSPCQSLAGCGWSLPCCWRPPLWTHRPGSPWPSSWAPAPSSSSSSCWPSWTSFCPQTLTILLLTCCLKMTKETLKTRENIFGGKKISIWPFSFPCCRACWLYRIKTALKKHSFTFRHTKYCTWENSIAVLFDFDCHLSNYSSVNLLFLCSARKHHLWMEFERKGDLSAIIHNSLGMLAWLVNKLLNVIINAIDKYLIDMPPHSNYSCSRWQMMLFFPNLWCDHYRKYTYLSYHGVHYHSTISSYSVIILLDCIKRWKLLKEIICHSACCLCN